MDALRSRHGASRRTLAGADPASAVLASVMGALNRFTGDTPRQDDSALVVLARK